MNLIEAFEAGQVPEFNRPPDQVIETLLSKLFFYDDRVIKVYKHRPGLAGDLTSPEARRQFYADDFSWNQLLSPEIYLRLATVKLESEDFYIEMKRIDHSRNLTTLLDTGQVSTREMVLLTKKLIEKVGDLTRIKKESLSHVTTLGWSVLQAENLEDLRQLAYGATPEISKSETDEVVNFLQLKSKEQPYIIDYQKDRLEVGFDTNSDNLLIIDGQPGFIDMTAPKENWRIADSFFTITRVAVDAAVLGHQALADAVYETYLQYRTAPPPAVKLIYEIHSAAIQWSYRHHLKQTKRAEKFKQFTLAKIAELRRVAPVLT